MKDGVIGHGWRMQAMTSRASIVASRIHREQQPLNMVHENHPLFGDPAIDPSKTCSSACRYEDADKRHFALLFSSTRGVWPRKEESPLAASFWKIMRRILDNFVDNDVYLQYDSSISMIPS